MTPAPSVSRQAGFTLAETMVALFILALVSSAGAALLMGATSSGKQVRDRDADTRRMDIAQALIRNDIAALSPRGIRPDDGFSRAGNLFGESAPGRDPFLSFVRSGWINPGGIEPRGDLQAIRYRLESGQLIRDVVVRPDAVQSTPVASRVLMEDVTRIDMRFQRGGDWSLEWIGDAGQPLHVLPDLIEMDIHFENGSSLIIAALTGGRS